MIFELIAAFVAGLAVAGIAMAIRWLSRGLLPKWIVPAAAGLGMLSYAIWSEYSWFSRATNAMPAGIEVAWLNEDHAFWRPWSYYQPVIDRFTAVDTRSAQRHPNQPGQVMIDVILAARWQLPTQIRVLFDCTNNRRADLLGEGVAVAEDGSVTGAKWVDLEADNPVLRAACQEN